MDVDGKTHNMTKSGESRPVPLQEDVRKKTNTDVHCDQSNLRSLSNSTCLYQQHLQNGLDVSAVENGLAAEVHCSSNSDMTGNGSQESSLSSTINGGTPGTDPQTLSDSSCEQPQTQSSSEGLRQPENLSLVCNGNGRHVCLCSHRRGPSDTQLQFPSHQRHIPVNGEADSNVGSSLRQGLATWCATGSPFPSEVVGNEEPSNDMESYFSANAHLLQDQEEKESSQGSSGRRYGASQEGQVEDPNKTLTSEDENTLDVPVENSVMQSHSDIDSSKSDSLHEEGFFEEMQYMQTRLEMAREGQQDDSFEDGDFIEPDIPRNAFNYASSSSNSRNSTTSSYEDLPTITTECDLHPNFRGETLTVEGTEGAFCYSLGNCPSCGGVELNRSGVNNRPATLNTIPVAAVTANCRNAETDSQQQTKPTSTSSSESSFKTTSSSFQSPQLSEGSVFCGCTPDSNSFPSHEDFLDSDLGSTWSRHTSHSSASNMPSAEVSYCASSDHHGCLCHNHADLLRLPHLGQSSREPRSNGASTSAASHPEDNDQCHLGLCTSRVHRDRECDLKANNCDNVNGAASGDVLPPVSRQSDPNQLDNSLCYGGACSMGENDPFCDEMAGNGHWSDSNIVTGAHGAVDTRERSGLLNVSRQTSTSNFDQDENSFQEDVDDRDLCQVCQKQLGLSEDEAEGEKQTNQDRDEDSDRDAGSSSPETESSSSSRIRRSQSAPGDVRRPGSLASLCMGLAQVSRQHNTLPGRLRVYGSGRSSACSHSLTDPAEMAAPAFSVFIQNYILPQLLQIQSNCVEVQPHSDADQVDKVMIWSEYEAYVLQVTQIDTSACGATAVINVLKALKVSVTVDDICKVIVTNRRAESAPLPEYLLSRSVAGATAEYLIEGIGAVTGGAIYGRFFPFYPERIVHLRKWLAYWLRKGAVPLATLNYQRGVAAGAEIPDAWHHQMVYGVGPRGIYMTNPQDVMSEALVQQQLCSDSVLLVRRQDVVSRWINSGPADLSVLIMQDDPRWREMNVLGQVVNVLREERTPHLPGIRPQMTSHIRIPAAYRAGITLFLRTSSPAYYELTTCPDHREKPTVVDGAERTDIPTPQSSPPSPED